MLIYRLEVLSDYDETQYVGVYREWKTSIYINSCPYTKPEPNTILGQIADAGKNERDYYYGFQHLDLLKLWFDPIALRAFREIGVVLTVWESDDYYFEPTQIAFRKSTATLISREPLPHF